MTYLFFFYFISHPSLQINHDSNSIAKKACLRLFNSRHIHNSVNRRINSLPARIRGAPTLPITATVIRVLCSNRQICVSQVILALDLIADVLLDTQVERIVTGVRLDAEGPVARDVLDLRTREPIRRLRRLRFRVPRRAVALDAPAILGVGQEVEADLAVDGGRRVGGVFGAKGGVSDGPAGDGGQRVWRALLREGGRWWAILLDVVHLRVPLFALRNKV